MSAILSKKSNKFRWLKRLLIAACIWVLMHALYICYDGLNDTATSADIAIVLGNRVEADGSLPPWTKGRMDAALKLYKKGRVKRFFISGGITKETNYPEATGMKAYLVRNGVPDSLIVADNKGVNTYHTAVNFDSYNKTKKFESVIVVSQFFHISRSKYIIRKMGFEGKIESAASTHYTFLDIPSTFREVLGFYKYWLYYKPKAK